MLKLKRVYETPNSEDGVRILVERLWPRGLTKEGAKIDIWLKGHCSEHRIEEVVQSYSGEMA